MTPEAQRIAIAKALGWNLRETRFGFEWVPPQGKSGIIEQIEEDGGDDYIYPPSYLSDLNACRDMEKVLTDDQAWEQIKIIVSYEQHAGGFPLLSRDESIKLHSATAPQRCEAFLRTLGLWTTTPTQEK